MARPFIHPTAIVEDGARIAGDTRIWHFVHVRSGSSIGARTQLGKSVYVDEGASIGADCRIQNFVCVYKGVEIGDSVFVGPSAVFTNDSFPRAANREWTPIGTRVLRGATIGANATIICGITIGEWAMVGAGAVVTHDVAPYALVVGNPARRVGWVCKCGRRVDVVSTECIHSSQWRGSEA